MMETLISEINELSLVIGETKMSVATFVNGIAILFFIYIIWTIFWFYYSINSNGKINKHEILYIVINNIICFLVSSIINSVMVALFRTDNAFVVYFLAPLLAIGSGIFVFLKFLNSNNFIQGLKESPVKPVQNNYQENEDDDMDIISGLKYHGSIFLNNRRPDPSDENSSIINFLIDDDINHTELLLQQNTTINEMRETLKEIKDIVHSLSEGLSSLKEEDDRQYAIRLRYKILDMSDRLILGQTFSKASFENIIISIDEYEAYCESHPSFKNGIATVAIKHILQKYEEGVLNGTLV